MFILARFRPARMKVPKKLWFLFAAIVVLVAAQGAIGWRCAAPVSREFSGGQILLLALSGLTLLLLIAAAVCVGKEIWRPLRRVAEAAREVAGGNYQRRVHWTQGNELARLADDFNRLLAALQENIAARAEAEAAAQKHAAEWRNQEALRRTAEMDLVKLRQELERSAASYAAQLVESERRQRTLLANLPGMAYRCRNDRDWTMEFVSAGCQDLLGYEPQDFIGRRIVFNDLIHPEDREWVGSRVQSALARQEPFALEYRVKRADGQWRLVWEQGRAVTDAPGSDIVLEGFIMDVTRRAEAEARRRVLENQLRRAQKMETIAALTGGIAHDFNNILAAILGSAELLKLDLPDSHPGRELLDQIFTAGHRAREVVQQLLALTRHQANERSVVHLQPVVKECVKLLRSTIPAMVEISCHADAECPPVLADSTQIHQIIMNLCTNAWHALPPTGGIIKVCLEKGEAGEMVVAQNSGLATGAKVRLSVHDNGQGMDKATLERIFEPFFTTKPASQGSGLGLSVVQGIVKSHHGTIAVDSQPGRGTSFHIYLPAQASRQTQTATVTGEKFSGHNEGILFVDDDELAGGIIEKALSRVGYRVKWFKRPEAALADFRAAPTAYDLVISDLSMPGMSGENLAATLLEIRPEIPILLTTGHIDFAIEERASRLGVRKVLLKPVAMETLSGEIARQLAGTKSAVPAEKS
jgi:PAS domain S-box-containing protein